MSRRWINAHPGSMLKLALGLLPFLLLIVVYQYQSDARKAENERDKLLPSFSEMADAVDRHAFQPSKRTGEYLLWQDTGSSLTRLLTGIGIAALIGLFFGLATGAFPMFDAFGTPLIVAICL
ncbi:MAG: ABC transporter permease, partial [Pseudomonadota bacterium]